MEAQRILWLTENYPPQRGGMAQSCDRIIDGLRKEGLIIDIVHFIERGIPFQTIQQINGTYTSIPFKESESHTLNLAWNHLQNKQISLLVCFGGYLSVVAAPVFAKWLGVPLVTMIRGNDFDTSIFTPRKRDMLKDLFESSSIVCSVTTDKKEKIEKYFKIKEVEYIPNGIDLSAWQPSRSELDFATKWKAENASEKRVLGVFGQLKAKKGIDFLIQAIASVSHPERTHVLLIGEIAEETIQLLQDSEIAFSHYSFMDRYELMPYYLCCDAMAIPSYYDGMPNVLLEAGALSIPVLASKVGGMQDLIENEVDGWLFEPGDLTSCRAVLHHFLTCTKDEHRAMGKQLQAKISNNFTSKQEAQRYEKLLKKLLGASGYATHVQMQPSR
jgi:glycosyltransferase involved in cell wall biosynthesis